MPRNAAIQSVNRAMKEIKYWEHQGFEWSQELSRAARQAPKETLEQIMNDWGGDRIAEIKRHEPTGDRRNGYYTRWLLTALGEIEICVPRSRTVSGAKVFLAY